MGISIRHWGKAVLLGAPLALMLGGAWAQETPETPGREKVDQDAVKRQIVERVLQEWSPKAREAAQNVIDKYGMPHELSMSRMIWNDVGPWLEIIAWRYEVDHQWPKPHHDFVEQVINYAVPADKADELMKFDGSVIAERTRGTLAARCHAEPMNILALNLAHDILEGKRSVEEAREEYARVVKAFGAGEKPAYTQKLQFEVAKKDAGDPDKAVLEAK